VNEQPLVLTQLGWKLSDVRWTTAGVRNMTSKIYACHMNTHSTTGHAAVGCWGLLSQTNKVQHADRPEVMLHIFLCISLASASGIYPRCITACKKAWPKMGPSRSWLPADRPAGWFDPFDRLPPAMGLLCVQNEFSLIFSDTAFDRNKNNHTKGDKYGLQYSFKNFLAIYFEYSNYRAGRPCSYQIQGDSQKGQIRIMQPIMPIGYLH